LKNVTDTVGHQTRLLFYITCHNYCQNKL